MIERAGLLGIVFVVAACGPGLPAAELAVSVDLSRYDPSCGVGVRREGSRLAVAWPAGDKEFGRVTLDLAEGWGGKLPWQDGVAYGKIKWRNGSRTAVGA